MSSTKERVVVDRSDAHNPKTLIAFPRYGLKRLARRGGVETKVSRKAYDALSIALHNHLNDILNVSGVLMRYRKHSTLSVSDLAYAIRKVTGKDVYVSSQLDKPKHVSKKSKVTVKEGETSATVSPRSPK